MENGGLGHSLFFGWVDARSDKKTEQKSQIKEKTTLNDVKIYMKYLR